MICVNGGQGKEVPGTWSATLEYLVRSLAPRFPGLAFAEVRYRIKSWQVLDLCIEDCRAAIAATTGPVMLVGFSMGGAVAISAADDPRVEGVIGLAPWIPDRLDVAPHRREEPERAPRVARPLAAGDPRRVGLTLAPRLRARARAPAPRAATR